MSKIDDGGPAFPVPSYVNADGETHESKPGGMSLLDYFAGQALAGMLADTTTHVGFTGSNGTGWPKAEGKFRAAVAESAYAHARAMLAARKAVQLMTLTRQRMKQLRRAVDQGRAVAAVVIPRIPVTGWDKAAFERNYSADDDRRDDLDAADNRGGLDERNRVARQQAAERAN